MLPKNEFLTLRQSFLPPIPELQTAANLLAEAADALLAGDHDLARDCLHEADMSVVHDYASRIMGCTNQEIHRRRPVAGMTGAATALFKDAPRMPGVGVTQAVYRRDGFRCRFCGCRVVLGTARGAMRALVPEAIRWGGTTETQHGAFFALTATIDHIVPHAAGGSSEPENLVTACWPCNFGRGNASIEEMGLSDPRSRQPVVDEWDGLSRMLARGLSSSKPKRNPAGIIANTTAGTTQSKVAALAASQTAWFVELDRTHAGLSCRLLTFLDECKDLKVEWRLNKVLVVNMASKEGPLSVLGIDQTGCVEVPWYIGSYKKQFRAFAHTLGAAIPDAVAYETPKMWRVRTVDHRVHLTELLDASGALKLAFAEFGAALES